MSKVLAAVLILLHAAVAWAGEVRVEIEPVFGGKPLGFDSLGLENGAGQKMSVARLDMHLSEIALQQADGTWSGLRDWSAYLSLREGRNGFTLSGVPAGSYKSMRFLVGLRPEVNASDATKRPAGHPLNPTVSSLWWGWSGGYVFLAIEGAWQRADHSYSGYSFHVATDAQLMSVELPLTLNLEGAAKVTLELEAARIFKDVTLNDERNSSHSREGDTLAVLLRKNIEQSWKVRAAGPADIKPGTARPAPVPEGKLVPFTYPAWLPMPQLPGDNPLTEECIALGKQLFHDRRLSFNNKQSCADCHHAEHGFTDALPVSIGAGGEKGTRSSMPLFNLAWKQSFFWDGRAPSLRDQVLQPISNPIEMHLPLEDAEKRTGIPRERMARALEQYLLTLVSVGSKFDRVIAGKEKFTPAEQRGFDLFHAEYDPVRNRRGADCFHCHGGPLFQSKAFSNNGLDSTPADRGLAITTGREADAGKFAVPSLRNIALTAPYMHDGRFATLEQVIDHYDHSVKASATLDPNLAKHPASGLGLSAEEKADLVSFLHTLTDETPSVR